MNSRGAVMVEMALIMSIVLMLIFGTIQLSMIAFGQSAQDGAAFVAAREYGQNAAGGTSTAQNAAHSVYSRVNASDVSLSTSGTTVTASAATNVAGLGVPGTPGTFPLESRATEPVAVPTATPASGPGNSGPHAHGARTFYAFSTADALANYRDYSSNVANPAYAIVTAQTFGTGHGVNGFFDEFDCRQMVYSGISFPAYPGAAGRQPAWDPINGTFRQIYSWDTGTTCA
ncbi:MAG: TadE/TadG family type IV pilus assembly protein [Candidatus Baltobacteraceae bacterium]